MTVDRRESARELAKAERELFDAATPAERRGACQAKFIADLSGARQRDVALRSILYRAGREAEPLWAEIDSPIRPISLDAAVDLLRVARAERRAVADVVEEFRRDNRKRYSHSKRARERAAPPRCPADPLEHVRRAIASWIASEIPSTDGEAATIAAQVSAEIEGSLRAARDRLRKRPALPGDLSPATGPTRADLRAAAALLGLELPRHRGAFDMVLVNRKRRGMLRAAHPDVVGDDSGVSAYQAVNDAYAVIVAYNDSVARSDRGETEKNSGNQRERERAGTRENHSP